MRLVKLVCPDCGHNRAQHTVMQCWAKDCNCSKGFDYCDKEVDD